MLDLDFIYSKLENINNIINDFLTTNTKCFILATSILEVSLNFQNIKYTISIDPIYSLGNII